MSRPRLLRSAFKFFFTAATVLAGLDFAHAEGLGGTISLQSDSRYRGISYSDEKPSAQATLAYDGPSGWYGGAMLTQAHFGPARLSMLLQGYAGRVFSLATGLDAEAGLQLSSFDRLARYNYAEAYAGLLAERWNARLYFSNDYFGARQRSLYAEVNLNWPVIGPSVQAFAHAGVIGARGGPYAQRSSRTDWRTGVAWRHGAAELQLAWVGAGRGGPYTWAPSGHRQTWTLGISAAF